MDTSLLTLPEKRAQEVVIIAKLNGRRDPFSLLT